MTDDLTQLRLTRRASSYSVGMVPSVTVGFEDPPGSITRGKSTELIAVQNDPALEHGPTCDRAADIGTA